MYLSAVGVVLFNHGSEDLEIKEGDRVAQLILEKYMVADEVVEVNELDSTYKSLYLTLFHSCF